MTNEDRWGPPLDLEALRNACSEVVSVTLWQAPNPHTIDDIVTAEERALLTEEFVKLAGEHADYIGRSGGDPNFITQAIRYLASAHALPPMKRDTRWFDMALQVLVELAWPNTQLGHESLPFLRDLRDHVDLFIAEIEEGSQEDV